MTGFDRPLIHSGLSHTACPTKREVGLAKEKPAAEARPAVVELIRSAVALSRLSSVGENQVSRLQSSPLKIRG